MTPTLFGRIQSRIFLVATVGVPLAFLLALFLSRPEGASYTDQLRVFFAALLIVAVVGVIWELIYHVAQQYRWEKDWPTIFSLLVGIPEFFTTWLLLRAGIPWDLGDIPLGTIIPMFVITWIVIWIVAQGPLQIVFPRWRYRGGRFV